MKFAPYWARGTCGEFVSWRWSFQSAAEAQALADQAAQQVADRIRHGDKPQRHPGYYPGRPFREEVVREIKDGAGELAAVITRNSYGCLVLNTSRVMFLDVDLPESRRTGGWLQKLFGKPDPEPPTNPLAEAVGKAEMWVRNHPGWGWRVYRTRAGLRLLATHALFQPEAVASDGIFDALGADPLYRQLCKTQNCFRARLTPKPWRCGIYQKPGRWPWLNAKAEARFRKWEAHYQTRSANWATCELIRKLGTEGTHPEVQPILNLHDELTRVESKLELA
jgi:hypothetical protein